MRIILSIAMLMLATQTYAYDKAQVIGKLHSPGGYDLVVCYGDGRAEELNQERWTKGDHAIVSARDDFGAWCKAQAHRGRAR